MVIMNSLFPSLIANSADPDDPATFTVYQFKRLNYCPANHE